MTDEKWAEFMAAMPTKKYTALKAIKDKCIECKGGEGELKPCEIKTCPLYWFLYQKSVEKREAKEKGISDELREHLKKITKKRLENKRRRETESNNVE